MQIRGGEGGFGVSRIVGEWGRGMATDVLCPAENHGFMEPLPLHGRRRCEGPAAVERVKAVLEPLCKRGDFAPESTRKALGGLAATAPPAATDRSPLSYL